MREESGVYICDKCLLKVVNIKRELWENESKEKPITSELDGGRNNQADQ
jgi:hypothetical protein